jgi:hypothetical protein
MFRYRLSPVTFGYTLLQLQPSSKIISHIHLILRCYRMLKKKKKPETEAIVCRLVNKEMYVLCK